MMMIRRPANPLVVLAVALALQSRFPASAQAQVTRDTVMAARAVALAELERQVNDLPLIPGWTVGKYLDDIDGRNYVRGVLGRAQLIGGPRVLSNGSGNGSGAVGGDAVVQVRLDIPGQVVADAVGQIAAVRRRRSPISPEVVVTQTRAWSDRTFTALGIAGGGMAPTSPHGVPVPPAPPGDPASTVVRVSELTPGAPPPMGVGSPAPAPATQSAVRVEEMAPQTPAPPPGPLVGSNPAPALPKLNLEQPPQWVFDGVDSAGTGKWSGSKLATAREAEQAAIRSLTSRLEALEVNPGVTLRSLAERDARWGEVIRRGLDRARVYRVEYLEDGSAEVKVATEPRYLWQDVLAVAAAGR